MGQIGPGLFCDRQLDKRDRVFFGKREEELIIKQIRTISKTNIYHIIIKGNNDEVIFYDDMDRNVFLERIKITKEEFNYKVYAYCLMSNHVHLVIDVPQEKFSKSIQSLTIRYASYFNKKYDRKGPFVQNRFKSKNIEDQRYFLEVCRYVHRNPEKAGIEKTNNYKWSSYNEYISNERIIDKKVLMYYLNNSIENFIKYTNKVEDIQEIMNYADFELNNRLNDEELMEIILRRLNFDNIEELINFFKNKENINNVEKLKDIKGINKSQLSRIIRIDRKNISKYWS